MGKKKAARSGVDQLVEDTQTELDQLRAAHTPPQRAISVAIEEFITTQGQHVGMEAWQTYYGIVAGPDGPYVGASFDIWHALREAERTRWNVAAAAALRDFAVWYDSGHATPGNDDDHAP